MPEQLWFTAILNHYLASPVAALMSAVGLSPSNPQAPITNSVAMELLVFILLIVFFVLVRTRLSVEEPGAMQHTIEWLEGFITQQSEEVIGPHSEGFTGFLTTLFIFILTANLIGLIPTLESPTGASVSVPLGLAIVVFVYYHVNGLRKHGPLKYAKQFLGPLGLVGAVIMLPIELISHAARLLSLTVRLWANIYAGDLITLVFLSLLPLIFPLLFLSLHIFVSLLQAYIFVLLTTVYLSGAVAEEH